MHLWITLPKCSLLSLNCRDIMSIYKEPPPGMFVVPDPQDMTKVTSTDQLSMHYLYRLSSEGRGGTRVPRRIPFMHKDCIQTAYRKTLGWNSNPGPCFKATVLPTAPLSSHTRLPLLHLSPYVPVFNLGHYNNVRLWSFLTLFSQCAYK